MLPGMSAENYLEAVNQIFQKDILCILKREYLSMLIEIPKEVEFIQPKYIHAGSNPTGVVRTETCENEQWIIESLYGIRQVTADEEMHPELNLIGPEEHVLSIADIAELLAKRGSLHIKKPIEVVRIESAITRYITILKEYTMWDLHFASPPQEDINMLIRLREMLEPLVTPYLQNKQGESPLAQLLRMAQVTISTSEKPMEPMISLNGANRQIEFTNPFESNKNPFSIRNFP